MIFISENKHAAYDLAQMQSLPLSAKIIMSQQRIKDWYEYWNGQVYVSFSGGKDSTVLLDLVRELYPNVPAVFVDTGLEYPEIREFVKTKDNVEWLRPEMMFKDVINTYGYPVVGKEQSSFIQEYRDTKSEKLRNIRWNGNKWGKGKISEKWKFLVDAPFKIGDKCCDIMKKKPAHLYEKSSGRHPILGVMANESSQRRSNWLRYGCNAFEKSRPTSSPLSFWTESDIIQYIVERQLDFASVYGEAIYDGEHGWTTGLDRTGCMFCMFGCGEWSEPNKFQQMKVTHPKQYNYCINKLGLGEVMDYIGVKYE